MLSLDKLECGAETTTSKGRSVHFGWGTAITAASNTCDAHQLTQTKAPCFNDYDVLLHQRLTAEKLGPVKVYASMPFNVH